MGRTFKMKQAHGISALEPAGSGQLVSILICMLLMNTGVKTFIKPASVERITLQEQSLYHGQSMLGQNAGSEQANSKVYC